MLKPYNLYFTIHNLNLDATVFFFQDEYYAELTRESGIARVPPVLFKIRNSDMRAKLKNLYTYRKYVYTVIDNETFTRRLEDKNSNTTNNTVM